ncbi:hypothetical protein NDU88_007889 [Pleurodeles waltl]|uniref:Uncharacterized protein n=1 Tax=Pleurodeles waltl TaxID=8319 RepID=A0AAV7PQ61_PLEWA|nr:hypothetical protein NDU88_007889 [Pleurodeles waltl]
MDTEIACGRNRFDRETSKGRVSKDLLLVKILGPRVPLLAQNTLLTTTLAGGHRSLKYTGVKVPYAPELPLMGIPLGAPAQPTPLRHNKCGLGRRRE